MNVPKSPQNKIKHQKVGPELYSTKFWILPFIQHIIKIIGILINAL